MSTRMPAWGAKWQGGRHMEGPRVSGPWLGVWGDNANALPHPTFYSNDSLVFIPCGTMSRGISPMQATWTCDRRRIQAQTIDRVDPSPRDHPSMHVFKKRSKWI